MSEPVDVKKLITLVYELIGRPHHQTGPYIDTVGAILQLAKEQDTIAVALTVALELAHENDKRAEKALARQHKAEGELKEIKHRMEGLEK